MTAYQKLLSMVLLGSSMFIVGCEGGAASQAPPSTNSTNGDQGSTNAADQGSTTTGEGLSESDGRASGSSSK